MKPASTLEFDNPWKDIIERQFPDFTKFFFPRLAKKIDWHKPIEFLDQELSKVIRTAVNKSRRVDKLVKVWLLDGTKTILYIHIEVQSQQQSSFPKRVFIYHYRLFDCYGPCVTSLVILGDDNPNWRPDRYQYQTPGSRLSFRFTSVKLWDYLKKMERLEKSRNPFALVVRTHLMGLQTRHSPEQRLDGKKALLQALYDSNLPEPLFFDLYLFLDWVLTLPEGLEPQFNEFVVNCEETKKMQYVTSIERRGIQQGLQQGLLQKSREAVTDVLKVRFPRVPKALLDQINALEDTLRLSTLLKDAAGSDSLATFEQRLAPPTPTTTGNRLTTPRRKR
jgi:hypothetical protein